jgi:hypothetical protein
MRVSIIGIATETLTQNRRLPVNKAIINPPTSAAPKKGKIFMKKNKRLETALKLKIIYLETPIFGVTNLRDIQIPRSQATKPPSIHTRVKVISVNFDFAMFS